MEFMDSLKSQAAGVMKKLEGEHPVLVQEVMKIVNNAQGGLSSLVRQMHDKGLGQIVSSWVGKGPNLPISDQQVQQAVGSAQIAEIAKKTGMDPGAVTQKLSVLLPQVVDHLTPDGQVPQAPAP
jgi:uncharacterized protein YidB (DUF937 family)